MTKMHAKFPSMHFELVFCLMVLAMTLRFPFVYGFRCAKELSHRKFLGPVCKHLIILKIATVNTKKKYHLGNKNKKCHKHVTNAPKGIGLA